MFICSHFIFLRSVCTYSLPVSPSSIPSQSCLVTTEHGMRWKVHHVVEKKIQASHLKLSMKFSKANIMISLCQWTSLVYLGGKKALWKEMVLHICVSPHTLLSYFCKAFVGLGLGVHLPYPTLAEPGVNALLRTWHLCLRVLFSGVGLLRLIDSSPVS